MIYRYSKLQETPVKRTPGMGADAILHALSERLLKNYSLATAMEKLKWEGLHDLNEERIDGLSKMLEQVRMLKTSLLQTYTLDHVLDGIKNTLSLMCKAERERLQAARPISQTELGSRRASGVPSKMEVFAQWVEFDFPNNLAEKLHEIRNALPEESPAAQKLKMVYDDLWRKISGFDLLVRATEGGDNDELKLAFTDLRNLITASAAGRAVDSERFIAKYHQTFDVGKKWGDWIDTIHKKRNALRQFILSVPFPIRMSLEGMLDFSFQSEPLAAPLHSLWDAFDRRTPRHRLRKFEYSGDRWLNLESALTLVERIHKLEELENSILSASIHGDITRVGQDLVREVLGQLAENAFQRLGQMVEVLVDGGYLYSGEDGYRLTSRALRRIGEMALADIFANWHWSKSTRPAASLNSTIHSFGGATKEYEYGDWLNLNLSSTLFNALRRGPVHRPPIPIRPCDFEIYSPEYISQNSTVLLIDMSSSMEDKFSKAKKVALALKQLISSRFPGDALQYVGFYSLARAINISDLLELKTMPFHFGHFPKMISYQELKTKERKGRPDFPGDFTNIQEGLRLSREILMRDRNEEKHIFLITDGEPTACVKAGVVYLESPATSDILEETLREVRRCTRSGIKITTFMLAEDRALREFGEIMGKINRGKIFLTPPEEIDQYVIIDYLRKKSYQVI
ncbi:MAG: VWA domain-containing protein [Desulfobacterales bacterium]|nr:MAG: VWA domain-containing protein [Desulfobacterales bacterium]